MPYGILQGLLTDLKLVLSKLESGSRYATGHSIQKEPLEGVGTARGSFWAQPQRLSQ